MRKLVIGIAASLVLASTQVGAEEPVPELNLELRSDECMEKIDEHISLMTKIKNVAVVSEPLLVGMNINPGQFYRDMTWLAEAYRRENKALTNLLTYCE